MGRIFKPKPGPSPEEITRRQAAEQARIRAEQEAAKAAENEAAQAAFASSAERKRQLNRKGKRTMIATPYGYLGDTSYFGSTGSLLS